MRVKTEQRVGFADLAASIPDTELDALDALMDWDDLSSLLESLRGDYSSLSLFKMMLLQTWHNLSDEGIASALKRDLVFIRFCGFSVSGNKPDATTLCRFRKRLARIAHQ